MILKYAPVVYKIISFFIGFAVIVYILPYFHYIYVGFQLLMEGQNDSFNRRLEKIEGAYILFQQSKLFGWGIAKSIHITVVDSDYLLILRRFGLTGFLLIFSFIIYPFFLKNNENDPFITALKFLGIAFAIIMTSNSVFHSYQAITAFIVLVSIATVSKNRCIY
jgi:O-antigen ligase